MRPDGGGGNELKVSLFVYHTPYGYSVTSEGEAVQKTAGDVQNFKTDVTKQHNAAQAGVAGIIAQDMPNAPTAVMTNAMNLMGTAMSSGGSIVEFGTAIDTFNAKVTQLNNILYATPPDKQEAKKKELWGQYSTANQALTQAGLTTKARLGKPLDPDTVKALYAAGAMPSYIGNAFPTIDFTGVNLTQLPSDIKLMTADERAKYLIAHPELAKNLQDAILADKATSDAVGKELAAQAKTLNDDSSNDDFKKVSNLINRFKAYPEVSAAMLLVLGPHDLIKQISLGGKQSLNGKGNADDFSLALRDVFRSGEPAMSESDARGYAHGLVEYFKDAFVSHENDDDYTGNDPLALSLLLRDSTLSTPFLDTMGDDLYNLEHNDFQHGFSWTQATTGALGGGGLFPDGEQESAFDPMTAYMSALGKNDTASLQFFDGGGQNQLLPADIQERQKYMIEDRYWGHDNFDNLMSALDAATTGDHTSADHNAHQLVTSMMDHLANRDGKKWGRDDGENFNPGDVGSDGTKHMAHIMGTYMAAVDYYLEHPSADDSAVGDTANISNNGLGVLEDMPVFRADDLAKFTKVGVSNEDGFDAMRSAVSNYQNLATSSQIQQHYGQPDWDNTWKQTTDNDARLEGFFLKNIGDVDIADGKDKDDQVKAWIDLGNDLAKEIPFDKVPVAGQAVSFLANHALDAGAEHMKDVWANNESKATDSATTAAEHGLTNRENGILRQLYTTDVDGPNGTTQHAVDKTDLYAAGSKMGISQAKVDAYFENGFPTNEQIAKDQNLQNLIYETADGGKLDMNEYKHSYSEQYQPYFPKP